MDHSKRDAKLTEECGDMMTKYGKIKDLKVKYYVLSGSSAWNPVSIGPFRTREDALEARKDEPRFISECEAFGFAALRMLEILDHEDEMKAKDLVRPMFLK